MLVALGTAIVSLLRRGEEKLEAKLSLIIGEEDNAGTGIFMFSLILVMM
jgi:hypothetical protein